MNKLLETKDDVVANGYARIPVLFDTSMLETEHDEFLQEMQVVSDMVQQCIYENAHVALDQAEYQKRYEVFLEAFEKLPDQLTEFTLDNWNGLVDYATVYTEDDIRFTFKNGQEVKA
ncbi:MAG: hypothetical protein ACOYBD_07245 [Bilifractor sp.]